MFEGPGSGVRVADDSNCANELAVAKDCEAVSLTGTQIYATAIGLVPDPQKPGGCVSESSVYTPDGGVAPPLDFDLTLCCVP